MTFIVKMNDFGHHNQSNLTLKVNPLSHHIVACMVVVILTNIIVMTKCKLLHYSIIHTNITPITTFHRPSCKDVHNSGNAKMTRGKTKRDFKG